MKKLFAILMLFCLMLSAMTVSAANIERLEPISLGQHKVVTIPAPTEPVDEGNVYFQQEFAFVPEVDGTYRFFMSYEEDPEDPYEIDLDVPGPYWERDYGIEFDAVAGEEYLLCFQYTNHDERYPQFTFYLGTDEVTQMPPLEDALAGDENPKTDDLSLLSVSVLLLAATTALLQLRRKEI